MMLRRSLSTLLSNGSPLSHRRLHSTSPLSLGSSDPHRSLFSSSGTPTPPPPHEQEPSDEASPPVATVSIDRSGLCNPKEHSHGASSDSELARHLKSIIKFRGGPISVAEYMEEVLINPKFGFYMNRDVFGSGGDFITSPEVSQMFGEMIGVWIMCLWEQMGQPEKVNLVELGPGRGTLMADLLRGSAKFKHFLKSLNVHLVECSAALEMLQYKTLNCLDVDISDNIKETISKLSGGSVTWHTTLDQVPSGLPTIIIAHEFYDALPVHQFQKASCGWCEKMVDVTENSLFRFVLSQQPTPATMLYLAKRCRWAAKEELAKLEHIEVSPKAMEVTSEIAKRISTNGGGALIIDYGKNGIVSDSLQAIRKHKFVDVLDDPGSADLSAYVDFASIRNSAEEASEDISVHGPISQSRFLGSLGINFRVEALLRKCSEEQAESLKTGYWRLVGDGEAPFWEGPDELTPIGMGTRYLVMAIVNKRQGVPIPFE